MEVYRISGLIYADRLTSSGRQNRWNLDGQEVIYAGSSRALSSLELLVHQNFIKPAFVQKVSVIHLPDEADHYKVILKKQLPEEYKWRFNAAYPELQRIGSDWYNERETLILKVPSAVITAEYNYVINTQHPEFRSKVKIVDVEDFFWDDRLFSGIDKPRKS